MYNERQGYASNTGTPQRSPIRDSSPLRSPPDGNVNSSITQMPKSTATPQQKALSIFPEFMPLQGLVSRKVFVETLLKHRLMNSMQSDGIFTDGDLNNDGFLSEEEFVGLLTHSYGTLLDILFFRWKDAVELRRLESEGKRVAAEMQTRHAEMLGQRNELTKKEVRVEEVRNVVQILEQEVEQMTQHGHQATHKFDCQKERVRLAADNLAEATADVKASGSLCDYRQEEESAWRTRCRDWEKALTDLELDLKSAEEDEIRLKAEYEAAQFKVRQKREMLLEGQANSADCRGSHSESVTQLEDAMNRAEGILQYLRTQEAEWKHHTALLHEDEANMINTQEKADERRSELTVARSDCDELINQAARLKEQLKYFGDDLARFNEHDAHIRQTQDKFLAQRRSKEDQETYLVAQELGLREERKKLQLKEVNLRGTVANVYTSQSPPR